MNSSIMRAVSRLLIASMLVFSFSAAQAGVIGTDLAINATTQTDRQALINTIDRPEVAAQLQAMGLSSSTAKERIAAMTDEEVRSLAGNIDSLPAGARNNGWGWFAAIVIGVLIYVVYTKK